MNDDVHELTRLRAELAMMEIERNALRICARKVLVVAGEDRRRLDAVIAVCRRPVPTSAWGDEIAEISRRCDRGDEVIAALGGETQ